MSEIKADDWYWAIGNGGHGIHVDGMNIPCPYPISHTNAKKGLFNMLPFVLRRQGNDLTMEEQSRYGPATVLDIGGTMFVAYYLKKPLPNAMGLICEMDEGDVKELLRVCGHLYNDINRAIISETGLIPRDAFTDGYQENVVKASMYHRSNVFFSMMHVPSLTLYVN